MRISSQVSSTVYDVTNQAASQNNNLMNEVGEIKDVVDSNIVMMEGEIVDPSAGVSKEKLQQAVKVLNDFLSSNNIESKFVFHDGLNSFYVQMVNKETKEVVKEIPPKKLLDAFYEMQKLVGMIVDEKI